MPDLAIPCRVTMAVTAPLPQSSRCGASSPYSRVMLRATRACGRTIVLGPYKVAETRTVSQKAVRRGRLCFRTGAEYQLPNTVSIKRTRPKLVVGLAAVDLKFRSRNCRHEGWQLDSHAA